jgi:hypothetical protein
VGAELDILAAEALCLVGDEELGPALFRGVFHAFDRAYRADAYGAGLDVLGLPGRVEGTEDGAFVVYDVGGNSGRAAIMFELAECQDQIEALC